MEPLFSNIKKSRAYQEIVAEIAQEKAGAIAKELLRRQMSVEFVTDVTGLSQREVRALRTELTSRKN